MSEKWREARQGALDVAPLLVAAVAFGLIWGTIAAGKGLSTLESFLMSLLVFAGAAQLVALEIWQTPPPILLLAFTVFIVNFRHVLMSVSISRHLPYIPRGLHPLVAFFLVDETWALAEKRALARPVSLAYFLGTAIPVWIIWCGASALGAHLGKSVGDPAVIGLDFAFAAMIMGILMGFWKGSRTLAVLAVAGVTAALTKLYVPGSWYVVAGGIAGALCAALMHRDEVRE